MDDQNSQRRQFWNPPKPLFNPWRRRAIPPLGVHYENMDHFGRFDEFAENNMDLDCKTKSAALKASPFVVCLTSYIGIQRLFICSGTIIVSSGTEGNFCSTILTSASLVRSPSSEHTVADNIKVDVYLFDGSLYEGEILGWDLHYNVAAVVIKSDFQLQTAVTADFDDSAQKLPRLGATRSFQLVPHRDPSSSSMFPRMPVIALGRYFNFPYHIMAAPGTLSMEDSGFDCEELLMGCCEITKNGIGGPLINYSGYVIGVNFYKPVRTPFLPINIALKCLEHLQKSMEVPRLWLGIKYSDLQISGLSVLEKLNQSFSSNLREVVVTKVEPGSPASLAGICMDDIIVQFGGKPVENSLKFRSMVLDQAKEATDVIIMRAGSDELLTLTLLPQSPMNLNRWPVPEEWKFLRPH